jgi:ATP-dependent Clp protease ATP-binding subunit ClpA
MASMSNEPDLSRINDPDLSRVKEMGTPRLKRILANSEQEAARRGHDDYIGVEHVFLAMLADGRSIPIQLLGRHIDLDAFRDELSTFLESDGYNRR